MTGCFESGQTRMELILAYLDDLINIAREEEDALLIDCSMISIAQSLIDSLCQLSDEEIRIGVDIGIAVYVGPPFRASWYCRIYSDRIYVPGMGFLSPIKENISIMVNDYTSSLIMRTRYGTF